MKNTLLLLGLTLSFSLGAQTVISEKNDDRFGGFFVDVEKSRNVLGKQWSKAISIAQVMKVQKLMRDCVQSKSRSFLRKNQAPFVRECARSAENAVRTERPKSMSPGLTVVFDMDETLLTQYHRIALQAPHRTTLVVKNRDFTLSESKAEMTFAPKGVTIRPGMTKLLSLLVQNVRIGKIYFFSAREDVSAEELQDYFLKAVPSLRRKFGGLYARNSLRLDRETMTPSKDLRIISPSLRNIILVDDNPSRVMQKQLNFTIPKFNADLYLDALEKQDRNVVEANMAVAPFINSLLDFVTKGGSFTPYSTAYAEQNKIDWGRKILEQAGAGTGIIEELIRAKIFEQEFVPAETVKLK